MKHRFLTILLSLILVLLFSIEASAATRRGRIPSNGVVYTFVANTGQSTSVNVMWELRSTDIDVFVFDSGANVVAASVGATDGLERLEFGVVRGEVYDVVLVRFRGSNSRYQVNVSTAGSEGLSGIVTGSAHSGDVLHYTGKLEDLVQTDERYVGVMEDIRSIHSTKRLLLRQ